MHIGNLEKQIHMQCSTYFSEKNPFHGEFAVFAGLEECVKFLQKFSYSESDIEYIRQILPSSIEEEFYKFLRSVTAKDISFYAINEGTVVFPRVPLIRVEGPLIVAQLLETTLLNLVNYASLMATNAARFRLAAGKLKLYEFEVNEGELAAFISFAIAFPNGFIALVDTYDVKKSGLINFCAVALALHDCGYQALGIRLDSGDLAYLSLIARDYFVKISREYSIHYFSNLMIMASNDINEETILSLNDQGHSIDSFGIGTHLVTCQKQPALGCVYKMVELNDQPRIKLSHEVAKVTIPGKKKCL
ncbi:hypothetical protein NQ314_001508 [Rhamnusium bicolor]|uniref:Nicotinate phosphoribosyltransferase n=1 Tax=Rhamnusium bicolor TaxID=1586634 RepID=A0AAV8ZV59_9CUCU|nr:hypothetical protein NQ314_001508 [Rhamnusium bicolor]